MVKKKNIHSCCILQENMYYMSGSCNINNFVNSLLLFWNALRGHIRLLLNIFRCPRIIPDNCITIDFSDIQLYSPTYIVCVIP